MTDKPDDYYRSERSRMTAYVPQAARSVLDVGCGAGAFGRQLKAERPELEVWGVEVVDRAAAEARPHLDHVVVGPYPEVADRIERTFDCVVFNDVLEHLVDPWTALEAAHPLVGRGGVVVASVPNIRNWRTIVDLVRHGRWDHEERGIHDLDHLRWFTRRTLVEAFEDAGWDVLTADMTNATRFRWARPIGALLRPVARDLGSEAGFKQIAVVATSDGRDG